MIAIRGWKTNQSKRLELAHFKGGVREAGLSGLHNTANALISWVSVSNYSNNRTWPLWLQKKSGSGLA